MNAPHPIAGIKVRSADLGDPAECRRADAWLAGRAEATPFHRPLWSLAVERGTGQRSHYLVAEEAGALIGLLPLTEMRSRLFGFALVSTGFGVEGGIIAGTKAAGELLASAAVSLARELGCPSVELRGGEAPAGWRRSEGVYAGFARDLPAGEEAILKSIPRKQRAEVRKGLGMGLDIRIGRDGADHYRVYAESVRNLGTPVFPRALFDAMLEAFGDEADILTVSRDGKPVASVLSLYRGGTAYPYWGGGTFQARGLRANELMYFALMRHAAERGCTRFDFGRSKFGTGAFAFKKNWGFEPRPLVYAQWGDARETNPTNPRYRLQVALWKKLPLWAANRIGPLIARGLG